MKPNRLWIRNHADGLIIGAVILGLLFVCFIIVFAAEAYRERCQAEIDAPYIASKDIAYADVVKNKGGGVKHTLYHYNQFVGGTGCLGMTIQVDVAHQSTGGKYTETSYCCDGKSCRLYSIKEF